MTLSTKRESEKVSWQTCFTATPDNTPTMAGSVNRPQLMDHPCIPVRRSLVVLLSLILIALPAPGIAQVQSWYAVEVVIFRHWEAPGDDAEFWPRRPPPISRVATQHLRTLGPMTSGADAPAFSRLPEAELQLTGIDQRLERSKDYEVLLHVGWRQPGFGPTSAPAVVLPLNWAPPSLPQATPMDMVRVQNPFGHIPAGTRLWGTLRLLRQRYLHFQVDLRFRRDGTSDALAGDNAVTIYPMIESQRMRSGEIHYLDHPVLGILVQIRQLTHGHEPGRTSAAPEPSSGLAPPRKPARHWLASRHSLQADSAGALGLASRAGE